VLCSLQAGLILEIQSIGEQTTSPMAFLQCTVKTPKATHSYRFWCTMHCSRAPRPQSGFGTLASLCRSNDFGIAAIHCKLHVELGTGMKQLPPFFQRAVAERRRQLILHGLRCRMLRGNPHFWIQPLIGRAPAIPTAISRRLRETW
jgi:hypothetical protein